MNHERARLCGVRFGRGPSVAWVDAEQLKLNAGDVVVVVRDHAPRLATVIIAPDQLLLSPANPNARQAGPGPGGETGAWYPLLAVGPADPTSGVHNISLRRPARSQDGADLELAGRAVRLATAADVFDLGRQAAAALQALERARERCEQLEALVDLRDAWLSADGGELAFTVAPADPFQLEAASREIRALFGLPVQLYPAEPERPASRTASGAHNILLGRPARAYDQESRTPVTGPLGAGLPREWVPFDKLRVSGLSPSAPVPEPPSPAASGSVATARGLIEQLFPREPVSELSLAPSPKGRKSGGEAPENFPSPSPRRGGGRGEESSPERSKP